MECDACFVTHGRSVRFHVQGKRALSRNELVFDDVRVSERQVTWRTYNDVTNEAQEEVDFHGVSNLLSQYKNNKV